jgi:hypothetical protein
MMLQLLPKGNIYTRKQAMQALGIKSNTTLLNYCKTLRIDKGLFYFTQDEFDRLTELRRCRLRGRNIDLSSQAKIRSQSA